MATITSKDGKPVAEQEQIDALIAMGVSPEQARFVVALEAGRVGGDVVAVDKDGNETTIAPAASRLAKRSGGSVPPGETI